MKGGALILQGDARKVALPKGSVSLIVTSPPYFALRSYQDSGEHYDGQIGSEPTPADFLDALIECTKEWVELLRDDGSLWVNLGDKYAGSGSYNNAGLTTASEQWQHKRKNNAPKAYNKSGKVEKHGYGRQADIRDGGWRELQNYTSDVPAKSLMGLPWRYAIRCVDELGLILRAEVVWSKPNGLPESVKDRVRRTHEQWFHFTKCGTYYAGIDEIRLPHKYGVPNSPQSIKSPYGQGATRRNSRQRSENGQKLPPQPGDAEAFNPLGKLPGSVWEIATDPLRVPEFFIEDDRGWRTFGRVCSNEKQRQAVRRQLWTYALERHRDGLQVLRVQAIDHFAAFPQEWPRRLILGWSPPGICTVCDQGRFPVVAKDKAKSRGLDGIRGANDGSKTPVSGGKNFAGHAETTATIIGYACACTPFTDKDTARPTVTPNREKRTDQDAYEKEMGGTRSHGNDWPEREARRTYDLDGWVAPPTRPAIVLDPFGGTGTSALIARELDRVGMSVDLSADYCRLARWRVFESGHGVKSREKTWGERQGAML